MEYRKLGRSGVKVSPLCLGTMNFGWRTDKKTSLDIIAYAVDKGINFIDTANVYSTGVSEKIVGEAIAKCRDQIVLATKVYGTMGEGPNERGTSRYHIMQQVEASLKRLKTDRIDLYQLHRPDPDTPIYETLKALDDLVRQGKVLYIGSSTFPAWQLTEALWISDKMNLELLVCEQPPYSMINRDVEREVLPFCQKYGLAVIPWSPLEGGWLAGKYTKGKTPASDSRAKEFGWDMSSPENKGRFDVIEKLKKLIEGKGCTLSQYALAWLLKNPAVTAPILGPRTIDHLVDNLGALDVDITDKEMKKIDEIIPPGTVV